MNQREFVFASQWHFLPEGVKKVQQQFEAWRNEKGLEAHIVYRQHSHSFLVVCPPTALSDEISKTFLKIYTHIINDQKEDTELSDSSGDDADDDDDEEVRVETKVRLICKIGAILERKPEMRFPKDVDHFKFKTIWTCTHDESIMDEIIPIADQALIESLTGAKLIEDMNLQRIFIGALTEESRDRTVQKLDMIRKYFFLRRPEVHHVFYAERFDNFQVSMKLLTSIKKKLYETTLLDSVRRPGGSNYGYRKLHDKTWTARCCVYQPINHCYTLIKGQKLLPATDQEDINLPLALWVGFTYAKKGNMPINLPQNHQHDEYGGKVEERQESTLPAVPIIDKHESITKWQESLPSKLDGSTRHPHNSMHVALREKSIQSPLPIRDGWFFSTVSDIPTQNNAESLDVLHPSVGPRNNVALLPASQTNIQRSLNVKVITKEEESNAQPRKFPNSFGGSQLAVNVQAQHVPGPTVSSNKTPIQRNIRNPGKWISTSEQQTQIPDPTADATNPRGILGDADSSLAWQTMPKFVPFELNPNSNVSSGNVPASSLSKAPLTSQQNTNSPDSDYLDEDAFPVLVPTNALSSRAFAVNTLATRPTNSATQPQSQNFSRTHISLDEELFPVLVPSKPKPTPGPKSPNGPLIFPVGPQIPKVQQQSEAENRTYHNTMRQGAPRPTFKTHNPYTMNSDRDDGLSRLSPQATDNLDPTEDFSKQIKAAMEPTLGRMRNWTGETHLEVEFGRILLRNIPLKYVADGGRANPNEAEWLGAQLSIRGGGLGDPIADFTNLVTALPGDIRYLISMRTLKGQNMWLEKPAKLSVAYQFELMDTQTERPFVIEIDAEHFTYIIKDLSVLFGKVNVHCTLRNWDYRIVAVGYTNLKGEYEAVAKNIVESLYIPEGLDRITNMSFQISHKHQVSVTSIRTRRNSQYLSPDYKSVLNITEVNDLFISARNLNPNSLDTVSGSDAFYHGFADDEKPIPPGPIWFEVGVMSNTANELFQQNHDLEFGDEVTWTVETMMSEGVVEAIYGPACEMVKQMDGVGFWNDTCPRPNFGVLDGSVVGGQLSKQPEKLDPSMHAYW